MNKRVNILCKNLLCLSSAPDRGVIIRNVYGRSILARLQRSKHREIVTHLVQINMADQWRLFSRLTSGHCGTTRGYGAPTFQTGPIHPTHSHCKDVVGMWSRKLARPSLIWVCPSLPPPTSRKIAGAATAASSFWLLLKSVIADI